MKALETLFATLSMAILVVSCGGDDATAPIISIPQPTSITYRSVGSGDMYAVAVRADGTLWGWGQNTWNQLGLQSEVGATIAYPGRKLSDDTHWVEVVTTQFYSLALKDDGTLWGWGQNNNGQLGISNFNYASLPTQVGTDSNWKHVEAGELSTVGLKTDGTLWGWGDGRYCGLNSNAYYSSPQRIGTDSDWKEMAFGMAHGIVIKTDGTLWGWGSNIYSEVGDNGSSLAMRQIGTDANWDKCFAGHTNSGAIKTDGSLWMWGNNLDGQIGNGIIGVQNTLPTQIGTDTNWKTLSIGADSCSAIKTDGTLWSWGQNTRYVLGTIAPEPCLTPQQRGTANNWKSLSMGYWNSYALNIANQLWGCGINDALGLSATVTTFALMD
jgi:alpha-tubulin suppressor-like RCC1 family protein